MLVRYLPELLQDSENHVMSDWGSSGRRFKHLLAEDRSRRGAAACCEDFLYCYQGDRPTGPWVSARKAIRVDDRHFWSTFGPSSTHPIRFRRVRP